MTTQDALAVFAHIVIAGLIAPMWFEVRRLNGIIVKLNKHLALVEERLKDCLKDK